jgi:hypothetical protein
MRRSKAVVGGRWRDLKQHQTPIQQSSTLNLCRFGLNRSMRHLAGDIAGLRRTAQPFGWTTPSRLLLSGYFVDGQYRSFHTALLFTEICNGLVNVNHDLFNPERY